MNTYSTKQYTRFYSQAAVHCEPLYMRTLLVAHSNYSMGSTSVAAAQGCLQEPQLSATIKQLKAACRGLSCLLLFLNPSLHTKNPLKWCGSTVDSLRHYLIIGSSSCMTPRVDCTGWIATLTPHVRLSQDKLQAHQHAAVSTAQHWVYLTT